MSTSEFLLPFLIATAVATLSYIVAQFRINAQARELAVLIERLHAKTVESESAQAIYTNLVRERSNLIETSSQLREHIGRLQSDLSNERKLFQDKLSTLENAREQMTLQFKDLANEILDEKSKKFTNSNQENIAQILKPLQDKIQLFEKRVEETYDKESKERFSLAKEIKNLQELNSRISIEAVNLTNALKGDNKTQGTWGEMVLESILHKSGLMKGREYVVQSSLKTPDGTRNQPDVVVHLPQEKDIIIDAKVSLKAYESYCSEDMPEKKAEFLKQHIQSIRTHVKLLSTKDYQNLVGVNSLDFVLLFMPVEASFSIAAQHDVELFMTAFEKNIIIVGPSTLVTTLRTVQNIWRLAQQNQNAVEIASKAGALYDKFVAYVENLEDVGEKIDSTWKSYEKARNKLISGRGNLVSRAENLKRLGAKTSRKHNDRILKELEVDDDPDASAVDVAKPEERH